MYVVLITYLKYFIHCIHCYGLLMYFLPALPHRKWSIGLCGRGLGGRGLSDPISLSMLLLSCQLYSWLCSDLSTCLQLCLQKEKVFIVNKGSRRNNCLSLLYEYCTEWVTLNETPPVTDTMLSLCAQNFNAKGNTSSVQAVQTSTTQLVTEALVYNHTGAAAKCYSQTLLLLPAGPVTASHLSSSEEWQWLPV